MSEPTSAVERERVGLEPLLTLDDVAALAGESRRTIERRVREGSIPVKRLSARCIRVTRQAAAAYLAGESADEHSDKVTRIR